jgi:hypothetical protein
MVFRAPKAAPTSRVPDQRRGHVIGRFCHGCNQIFALQRRLHSGDPIQGRDHVASTCPYEGSTFEAGASWWELAVDILPAPAPAAEAQAAQAVAAAANLGATAAGPAQPQTTSAPQQGQPAPQPTKP